jgi:hypothetical protein
MSREEADRVRLDGIERTAFAIVFGMLNGGEFDWQRMRFKEPGEK